MAITRDFLKAGKEKRSDAQIERYNGDAANIASVDKSIIHQREALHQAIKDSQREFQDIQPGWLYPGMPGGIYPKPT